MTKEVIKQIVLKEYNDWYQFYLRKAKCPSEYSRGVAPSQMDAIDNLKNDIIKAINEYK